MGRALGPRKLPPIRNRYYLALDLLLIPLGAILSFLLRLDFVGWRAYASTMLVYTTLALVVKPGVYFLFGLYRRVWRYASSRELISIASAATLGAFLTTWVTLWPIPLVLSFRPVPRSIPFIDCMVSLALVGGPRFAMRVLAEYWPRLTAVWDASAGERDTLRVLVMGAGDAGVRIVREMQAYPGLGLESVGLLDDDRTKVGGVIHGVSVLGGREDIPRLVRKHRVDEVIIAMPSAPGRAIREVVEICRNAQVAYKTVPGMHELISGQVSIKQMREVGIEDLLRRDPVQINGEGARRFLAGAVVLVTGAGGSIGSELCRQIATYHPRRLLLLGHGENSIYHIQRELQEAASELSMEPVIADIRDGERLVSVFAHHRPEVVFHAAAHKHVPLMECNVAEAVMNNIFGTQTLLQAASAHGTRRFVLVSTDKAVNPVNVMGATKRVTELLVQEMAQRTGQAYTVVRFGNVLGSRGSVVPLFQQQIAAGGPITLTHPDMERFFMTIPEAVQLVIQAAALGQGGEIFVLDMGDQVRVVDLATELIHLSGLELERDIDIVFTRPRPGEKLSEELFSKDEEPRSTMHEKILMAYGNNRWGSEELSNHLDDLEMLVREGDVERICTKLREIVPEYEPRLSEAS